MDEFAKYFKYFENNQQPEDAKINELLGIFRNTLLKNPQRYADATLNNFADNMARLFNRSENNYLYLTKYHRQIYEIAFDVISSKEDGLDSSKRAIIRFASDLQSSIHQCKATNNKDFQSFVVKKMTEICGQMLQNPKIDPKQYFLEFANKFGYLLRDITDKSLAKPLLDLAIAFLTFKNNNNSLHVTSLCLCKFSFFNLKTYANESVTIVSRIFQLAFDPLINSGSSDNDDYLKNLAELSKDFCDKLNQFPKTVELVQTLLWNDYVCKPIEKNIQDVGFFKVIAPFKELVSAKTIPTSSEDLNRLEKVFKLAVSEETLRLLDPDSIKFYEQPAAYYLEFHRLMAETIKLRDDFKARVEKDLITLIDNCVRIGNFVDELQPGGLTIYYFIGLAYTTTFMSNQSYDLELIEKVLTMWFDLKEVYIQRLLFSQW